MAFLLNDAMFEKCANFIDLDCENLECKADYSKDD